MEYTFSILLSNCNISQAVGAINEIRGDHVVRNTFSEEELRYEGVSIEIDSIPNFYYALHINGVPLINSITLINGSEHDLHNVRLVIKSDPDFLKVFEKDIDVIQSRMGHRILQPEVIASHEFLSNSIERIEGCIEAVLYLGEVELCKAVSKVSVMDYSEWPGITPLQEILGAFVLPNAPEIDNTLRRAAEILAKQGCKNGIDAYQSNSTEQVGKIVSAIYEAVEELNIAYSGPPASFEAGGQKIRFPAKMISTKLATCFDMSLFFAACIEQAGLNALVFLTERHSFVGIWMQDMHLSESVINDSQIIRDHVKQKNICAVESTTATGDRNIPFESSVELAEKALETHNGLLRTFDIGLIRMRVKPLSISSLTTPFEGEGESGTQTTNEVRNVESVIDDEVTNPGYIPGAESVAVQEEVVNAILNTGETKDKESGEENPATVALKDDVSTRGEAEDWKKRRIRTVDPLINAGKLFIGITSSAVAMFVLTQILSILQVELDTTLYIGIGVGMALLVTGALVFLDIAGAFIDGEEDDLFDQVKSRFGLQNLEVWGIALSLIAILLLLFTKNYKEILVPIMVFISFIVLLKEPAKPRLPSLKVELKPLAQAENRPTTGVMAEDIQREQFNWVFVSKKVLPENFNVVLDVEFSKTQISSLILLQKDNTTQKKSIAQIASMCLSREGINGEVYQIAAGIRKTAIKKRWVDIQEIEAVLSFAAQLENEEDERGGNWRYPSITMWERKGSELDKNIMAAAIFMALGYKVAIFDYEDSVAVGISVEDKAYFSTQDLIEGQYIYCKVVTGENGWVAGVIPEKYKGAKHEKYLF